MIDYNIIVLHEPETKFDYTEIVSWLREHLGLEEIDVNYLKGTVITEKIKFDLIGGNVYFTDEVDATAYRLKFR
jgi:hypothetical protein